MKRIEVEPLSEQRWARVERDLFEELDRREAPVNAAPKSLRRPALAAAAVLVAACALLALALWPRGSEVARLMQVETIAEARTVEFAGAHVHAEPRTSFTLSGDDSHGALAALSEGTVEFSVPTRRAEHAPFVVQAGGVRVRVLGGGAVRVAYLASETRVAVRAGTVEVVTAEARVLLGAGEEWPRVPAKVEAATPRRGDAAGAAVASDPPAEAGADDLTPASASPSAAPVHDEPRSVGTAHSSRRHRTGRQRSEAAPDAPGEDLPQGDRARFEQAARMEGTQPDEAAALYRQLSERAGSWAENALFALGRLELERGHKEAARTALTRYLARHPSGRNAEDAARLLRQVR